MLTIKINDEGLACAIEGTPSELITLLDNAKVGAFTNREFLRGRDCHFPFNEAQRNMDIYLDLHEKIIPLI